MITVELVGGPADGYMCPQNDVRTILTPPPSFGCPEARYRLRDGQVALITESVALANRHLLYDYQPPEKAGA